MIRNFSELLKEIMQHESSELNNYDMSHAPTIGEMYEGLTDEILQRSLPEGSHLKVVTGFIIDDKSNTSKQIDCMLVEGEGERIPKTKKWKYHIKNVVAVIESKKTLGVKELADGYRNLQSVKNLNARSNFNSELFSSAFRHITQRGPPNPVDVPNVLSPSLQNIYHVLMEESCLPLRIIFGYNGWKTEKGLREAFCDYLGHKDNELSIGFGPLSLPDLIVSEKNALVKFSGMPYYSPLNKDQWHIYFSYAHNSMLVFLELLWTRISYRYGLPSELFGDDFTSEMLSPLLSCNYSEQGSVKGWTYTQHNLNSKILRDLPAFSEWVPSEINTAQFTVFNLIEKRRISIDDFDFREHVKNSGFDLVPFIDSLINTNLIGLESNVLVFISELCATVFLPNGKCYAAENATGRLTRWAIQESEKIRRESSGDK